MRVLITGSAGFVGHHAVNYYLEKTDWDIVGLDSFRHRGDSLRVSNDERYQIFCHDLTAPISDRLAREIGEVDVIINSASLSHVDTSISDPAYFWVQNTALISNILEYARKLTSLKAFIQVSTDEVFGAAQPGYAHHEWDVICPSNPYAASKAAQEALCISYWRTFNVPVIITNCMNMIGTRQDPEKFVPRVISRILKGEEIVIHGEPGRVGSRMYLDCRNLADAWKFLIEKDVVNLYDGSKLGEQRPARYNIAGLEEVDNFALVERISKVLGLMFKYRFENFHKTRPGHDFRYALSSRKILELGWTPPFPLDTTLFEICEFMKQNETWLEESAPVYEGQEY